MHIHGQPRRFIATDDLGRDAFALQQGDEPVAFATGSRKQTDVKISAGVTSISPRRDLEEASMGR